MIIYFPKVSVPVCIGLFWDYFPHFILRDMDPPTHFQSYPGFLEFLLTSRFVHSWSRVDQDSHKRSE